MKTSGAIFSEDRKYRYVLWRVWNRDLPLVNFIGLNPSTADEKNDDATMRRCRAFAKEWGYGGFYMTNLFAFCTNEPSKLREAVNPVGEENDRWISKIQSKVEKVVFAWGTNGTFLDRDKQVIRSVRKGHVIGLTKGGHPKHPLYLKSSSPLIPFDPFT